MLYRRGVRLYRLFFRAILSARFWAFDLSGFFLTSFFLSCPFAMGEESIRMRQRPPQNLTGPGAACPSIECPATLAGLYRVRRLRGNRVLAEDRLAIVSAIESMP